MQNMRENRVLGRVMARDLTEREAESVGGAHGGGGGGFYGFQCPNGFFVSEVLSNGGVFCDPDEV